MSDQIHLEKPESKILSIAAFKKKKDTRAEISRGRKPLYMNHSEGQVFGRHGANKRQDDDFGDRLGKIRTSLDRINQLMAELKKLSGKEH